MKKIKWYRVLLKQDNIINSTTRLSGKTGSEDIEEDIEIYQEFIIKSEHLYPHIFIDNKSYSVIKSEEYK